MNFPAAFTNEPHLPKGTYRIILKVLSAKSILAKLKKLGRADIVAI